MSFTKFVEDNLPMYNTDYWYYYEGQPKGGGLSAEECNKIIEYSDEIPVTEATIMDTNLDGDPEPHRGEPKTRISKSIRSTDIRWVPYSDDTHWMHERLGEYIIETNNLYWGFNIIGMTEGLQYGTYKAEDEGQYRWHLDIAPGTYSKRKISCIIQLTSEDDYEGGEVEIWNSCGAMTLPRTQGSIILFPSFLLHRVLPVTQGVRKSLVCWISGPAFQ